MPKVIFPGGGGGGGVSLTVQEEGVDVQTSVSTLNFVGADVQAQAGGAGIAIIYIPTPTFASHFNTTDGDTTATVIETLSRSTAFISAPTVEGTPFETGGWAGSNQSATTVTSVVLGPGGVAANLVTAMDGSTFAITVSDGDGTVMETYTTPAITGNGTSTSGSGDIIVTITNYQSDTTKFKANVAVTVTAGDILTTAGFDGGRYQTVVTQTVTDGTGPYTYTQPGVFYDTNPSTPSIGGAVTISETGGSVLTKHLSGVEYYIIGSDFTMAVVDMNNLNRNTARISNNLQISAADYGISALEQSPISGGAGNANFSGWTTNYNIQAVDYQKTDYAISSSNYRFRGNSATAGALVRDTWSPSGSTSSSTASILVDTYTSTSGDLYEAFDAENKRQASDYTSAWVSATALTVRTAATAKIEVVDNTQIVGGDTVTLRDSTGTPRVLTAGANFTVGAAGSNTATNIVTSITTNFNTYFTAVVDSYTNTIVNVTEIVIGPSGNQVNTSSRPAAITVSNFEEGANDALVMAGQLMAPNTSTLTSGAGASNWVGYSPTLGGANPNYSALGVPAVFFRTITDTTGLSRSSFQFVFTGTFVVNATTDLANSNMRIFLRKVASPTGGALVGKTIVPMRLHGGTFGSDGAFNQGQTVGGSYVREGSSSVNTVNGTFGTYKCEDGLYIEIQIYNASIKIDRFDVTFF